MGWFMAYVHLAIVGNIGSGKSDMSLYFNGDHPEIKSELPQVIQELSRGGGIIALKEAVEDDPNLITFYDELKTPKTSIEIEEGFLRSRVEQQEIIQESQGFVIEERPPWEGARVFVPAICEQGKLSSEDLKKYERLYKSLLHRMQIPTLIAYIRVSDVNVLLERIKRRGKEYERNINPEHLIALNKKYEDLFHSPEGRKRLFDELGFRDVPIIEIDANIDFRDDKEYFKKCVDQILAALLKRRKMKIGFVGTHGSGKTYLVSRIHAEIIREGINSDIVKEVSRILPRGFEVNRFTTPDAQEHILRTQINKEVEAMLMSEIVVCDRITLDNYAYYVRRFGRREGVEQMLRRHLLEEPYDFIFKVPPIGPLVDDGFRDAQDLAFQRDIDRLVDKLMARFMPTLAQAGTKYIKLKTDTLNRDNIFPPTDPRHRDPWVYFVLNKIMTKFRMLRNYGSNEVKNG